MKLLRVARRHFYASRTWRRVQQALAIAHRVEALEATYSARRGWHPHAHAELFLAARSSPSGRALARCVRDMRAAWSAAVRHALKRLGVPEQLWAEYLPSQRGLALGASTGTGDYIVKPDSGYTGRRGASRTPAAIMHAAAAGDRKSRRLWSEYARAMRGQHLVTGLGHVADPASTDSRSARVKPDTSEAVEVSIPVSYMEQLRRIPGAELRVLKGTEQGGLRGAAHALALELYGVGAVAALWMNDRIEQLMGRLDSRRRDGPAC